jgi:hypothetical protein
MGEQSVTPKEGYMDARTERQHRIEQLVEQGYSPSEAGGRARAEEAGFTPPKAHGVEKAGTVGLDRPGPKAA